MQHKKQDFLTTEDCAEEIERQETRGPGWRRSLAKDRGRSSLTGATSLIDLNTIGGEEEGDYPFIVQLHGTISC